MTPKHALHGLPKITTLDQTTSTPASLDEASLQQINIDPEYSWFLVETDLPTSSKPQLFDRFYVMTHDTYI